MGCRSLGQSGWPPPDQTPDESYPLLRVMLRVCDPKTGDVLSRGEAGELHLGGPQIITRYFLGESQDAEKANSCFYDDHYGHWIKTGDRTVMAENGLTKILGRYKDLVIRGGEKIDPSTIEKIFAESFGVEAEVVGISDEIAGEVPIAVVKLTPGQELNLPEVREKIIQELGSAFAIEKVIPITDLGMENYPKTPSGKAQKGRLRDMVAKHLQDEQDEGATGRSPTYWSIEALSQLWVEFLGIHSTSLTPQTSVRDFADSLMISLTLLRQTSSHYWPDHDSAASFKPSNNRSTSCFAVGFIINTEGWLFRHSRRA